jgi:hypothetical protein
VTERSWAARKRQWTICMMGDLRGAEWGNG